MKYNNSTANYIYEKEQKVNIEICRKAGMSEEDIEKMCAFDREVFKSNRRFKEHNIFFDDKPEMFSAEDSPLAEAYPEAMVITDSYFEGTKDYVVNFETEILCDGISRLTEGEWDMLWKFAVEKRKQKEIAEELKVSQAAVCKKKKKIIRNFK